MMMGRPHAAQTLHRFRSLTEVQHREGLWRRMWELSMSVAMTVLPTDTCDGIRFGRRNESKVQTWVTKGTMVVQGRGARARRRSGIVMAVAFRNRRNRIVACFPRGSEWDRMPLAYL